METASSSDAIDITTFSARDLTDPGIDNLEGNATKLSKLKARFYTEYGELYRLKGLNIILNDPKISTLLVEGKNTVKVIISDLNINDFKQTVPYFDQKKIVSESSLTRAERDLITLERINSEIRRRIEELDQLTGYSI